MVTAACMDYVAVTFSSYYFNQVTPDLCLLGKSAVSFLGPPLPPQHNKGISSPFGWGCVLPRIELVSWATLGFPCGSAGKESSCNAGYLGSIPELGRSPGEGKGYPLQYSGLENYRNCMIHGVTKSRTQLSDFHSLTYLGHLLQSCLRD